jgi:2-polyprenyl-3-methyl-5-hydroxy-6-metoxy-1,4-benzoquinol methylase/predicted O-methyltransferase YrrM
MIEQILEKQKETNFDFTKDAHPNDSLAQLSAELVPYYRFKYAISAVLKPASILDIGVRQGYSAISMLVASPKARYLGLCVSDEERKAIEHLRNITKAYRSTFLLSNVREITELPGGEYDLIHINCAQDGASVYHHLTLALQQARYIVLDGLMSTKDKYRSAYQFLHQHGDAVQYSTMIPDYEGQLLICVSDRHRKMMDAIRQAPQDSHSADIRDAYNDDYYTRDCGGYQQFDQSAGKELLDPRMQAIFSMALPGKGMKFLDVGCGRGEITYQAAKLGAHVTAVDYSQDAIRIARGCIEDEPELQSRVAFHCADITQFECESGCDRVVAADLIEHLNQAELELFFSRIASSLVKDGRLVIHTAPSIWFYQHYETERKRAAAVGEYLPENPRTAFEQLMHINEQSPNNLKHTLRKHFPHTVVWVSGDDGNFAGSLAGGYSTSDYRNARNIFAVASHDPIDQQSLLDVLTQHPLPPEDRLATIEVESEYSETVPAGQTFRLPLQVCNKGGSSFASCAPSPVCVSYHWKSQENLAHDVFEGKRSAIPFPLPSGETRRLCAVMEAPPQPGKYKLQLTLIQEGICWFEQHCPTLPLELSFSVR